MKRSMPETTESDETAATFDDAFVELAYSMPGKKRIIKRSKARDEVRAPMKARRYA